MEAKAHELAGQLGPSQLAAVVQLMEVMLRDDDELTEEDRRAVSDSREYFRLGGTGLSLEELANECGIPME